MDFAKVRIRDPFVFKKDNYYLVTGTTDYTKVLGYKSYDLKTCSEPIILFEPKKFGIDTECAWAAEIHYFNNFYYMFVTLKPKGEHRGTYIAKCKELIGEYKLISSKPITPEDWECLDATFFKEKDKLYTIFCREWTEVKNGEIYIAELTKDLTKLIEKPKLLFRCRDAKWTKPIFTDGYVTDGPFVYKVNNEYRMLWSSFCGTNYALSIINSNSLLKNWKQEDVPLISNDAGHGMIFEDNGKIKLVYHYPNKEPYERLKIEEIDVNKGYAIN